MEDNESINLKTYSKVWKIEHLIYNIGGKDLPQPVAIKTALYFIAFFIIIQAIPGLDFILSGVVKKCLAAGALAYLFSKKLLDGKNPIFWLKSNIIHFIRWIMGANHLNRYKEIKKDFRAKYGTRVTYRTIKFD